LFWFSIRNAFRRKWVLIIAILGTGLGCALMTVLMSLSAGMEQRLDRTMTELAGVLVVYPEDAPLGYSTGGDNVTLPRIAGGADRVVYLRDGSYWPLTK
jgi:ABC-type lipoprotein release transport system permease subunit